MNWFLITIKLGGQSCSMQRDQYQIDKSNSQRNAQNPQNLSTLYFMQWIHKV